MKWRIFRSPYLTPTAQRPHQFIPNKSILPKCNALKPHTDDLPAFFKTTGQFFTEKNWSKHPRLTRFISIKQAVPDCRQVVLHPLIDVWVSHVLPSPTTPHTHSSSPPAVSREPGLGEAGGEGVGPRWGTLPSHFILSFTKANLRDSHIPASLLGPFFQRPSTEERPNKHYEALALIVYAFTHTHTYTHLLRGPP